MCDFVRTTPVKPFSVEIHCSIGRLYYAQLALETADRAYVLGVGRIVKEGIAEEMLDDPFIQETYMGMH